jgi:hypothetical protein
MLDFNAKDNCAQENMTLGSGTMRTFVDKKGRWVPGEGGTHSLPGKGVGGSQFRRGDRYCGTLGLYVLCVVIN